MKSLCRWLGTLGWSIAAVTVGLLCLDRSAFAAEDLAKVMPSGAVMFVKVSGLEPLIDKLQHSQIVASLPANPQIQAFYATPQGRKIVAGKKVIENQLGMDLWTLAKTALGGNVAVSFYPHEGRKEPDAVVVVQTKDAASLDRIRERVTPLLTLIEENIRQSTGPGDVSVRSIDGKLFVAERDDWIVLASTSDLMNRTLSLRTGASSENAKSLADDAPYAQMTKQMGSQHLVRSFVNVELISKAMNGRIIPEKLDNGGASLLSGGLLELFARSPFVGSTVDLDDKRLLVTHAVAGQPESLGDKFKWYFPELKDSPGVSLPNVPGLIGGWSLNRDFAGWYQKREELLQSKVLPEFDKFESGLGNLMPNRDFGTDILPTLGRRLTFVAAPQSFSHLNGKPGLQLPGFGLIVDLAKPEEGAETMNLFFQTISAITNLNAGQQGRQPWVLSSESYKDVQISFGKYGQKPKGDRLPVVFNFMPASARIGDKFVMTSSVDLCKQLIDAYSAPGAAPEPAAPATRDDFLLQLTGESVAAALEANRGLLEARSVAQEGKSAEQAQSEITTFLQIIRGIRSVRLTTGAAGEGYRLQLEAQWK